LLTQAQHENLQSIAREIRGHIIRMLAAAQSGHPGGSLSSVELLPYLYFQNENRSLKPYRAGSGSFYIKQRLL
jgi:transketolase N-terminal domain/subunit